MAGTASPCCKKKKLDESKWVKVERSAVPQYTPDSPQSSLALKDGHVSCKPGRERRKEGEGVP